MTRSARPKGPLAPRWVRGLLASVFVTWACSGLTGCGLSYVFRNIAPLHPTGWSFAFPILPSQQQRLEHDISREKNDRVPILDPVPGEFGGPTCLDPPSEAEVWEKVPKFKTGCSPFYETQRNNVRFLIEKIGDKADPSKIYPLAGPCQLIHCHYKCTIYFDENYWSDYPIPFHARDARVEVIYIDKDYLRRVGGPATASSP